MKKFLLLFLLCAPLSVLLLSLSAFAQDAITLQSLNNGSTTFACGTFSTGSYFTLNGWDQDDDGLGAPTWSATCLYNCTSPNPKGNWYSYGGDTFTMKYYPPTNGCAQTFSIWDWTITIHDGSTVDKYITVLKTANTQNIYASPDETTWLCGGGRIVFKILGYTYSTTGTWAEDHLAGVSLPAGTFDNVVGDTTMYGWTPPTGTACGTTYGTDIRSLQFTAPDGSITALTMHLVQPGP